jgi:murein DD-endopeptidase MepM/ murein hydrolase activator NlpD
MKEKVTAITDCKVFLAKPDDGTAYGNRVYIKDTNNQALMFAHLDSIAVKGGQKLKEGDIIGEIGSTGYSPSGDHLHVSLFPIGAKSFYAKDTVDPKEYSIKNGYPCRTILTNPYGSPHFNNTKDSTLKSHEGNDFSSYRLRPEYKV